MNDFDKQKILIGITGGVAAFKTLFLIRMLIKLGAEIRVVMSESAKQFVTPMSIQALCGHPPRDALFDVQAEKGMGHIELARWADLFVIVPTSANCLAKLAQGQADDLLSTLYLVNDNPVLIAPAMNHSMWQHAATRRNVNLLRQDGVHVLEPEAGAQACGEYGPGRLPELDAIIDEMRLMSLSACLIGRQVLVTAGPTIEPIDPVRYLTNRSSGKMGYALARAALRAGAEVTLISGPVALTPPQGVSFHGVSTAAEMAKAVSTQLSKDMIVIGCAAVSDFSVQSPSQDKIKRGAQKELSLNLTANSDIIFEVAQSGLPAYVVGFAAETNEVIAHARQKLNHKQLDLIVANQVGQGQGFEQADNEVSLITSTQKIDLPKAHKTRIAAQIVAFIASTLQNTPHSD